MLTESRAARGFRKLLILCLFLVWAVPAFPKTIRLTIIAGIPPMALAVKVTKDYFIPQVNKELAASGHDLKIQWNEAWSGTVAKLPEVFSSVSQDVGQIGVQVWAFEGSKLPLENISFSVPFVLNDPVALVKVFHKLHQTFPALDEEFTKQNQVHLASWATESDQLITTFPVTSLASLKGHKIGTSGSQALFFANTGAVAVSSGMDRAMESMRSGLYDGYPSAISLMVPYHMYQSAKYLTKVNIGALINVGLSMNKKAFDALPGYAQKIFKQVAYETGLRFAKENEKRAVIFQRLMQKKGVHVSTFPAAQRKLWADTLPNIAQEWAKRTDARGLPGTKLLDAYMNAIRAIPGAKKDIVRNWDRE